ncbi:neur_chan_LBD domain-containing protein [Trichonephila clavipes]|nr:neur_chan_LBD domain-containing protein [Trichonephila clavipes]
MPFPDESIRNVGERDSRKPFSPTSSGSNTIRFWSWNNIRHKVIMVTARDENEYRLTKYLLSNYDKSVRPARHTAEPVNVTFGLALTQIIDVAKKDCNVDHKKGITDFVQSIPGFQECDEDIEIWMAIEMQKTVDFKMLIDDEIVTSVQAESDPIDKETDEEEDNNNESSKGPSNACAFSVL